MKVSNVYTSIACNRTTEAADWGHNGLIVFSGCHAVAIFDPKFNGYSAKITNTYVHHTKRVNTVRWLRERLDSDESHFLSGADDGLAVFWNIANPSDPKLIVLKGHESGVNTVDGIYDEHTKNWLVVTAAADSTLRVWKVNEAEESAECMQTILLHSGYCFTLRLTRLPKSNQVLLAYSGDDESVSLMAQIGQSTGEYTTFQRVHKLLGHEDWVRGLDFVADGNDLLLASSGQDNFIRLWRIAPRTQAQVQENKVDLFKLLESEDDIRVEEKIIEVGQDHWCAVSVESVLYGHEGWVYGVQWHKSKDQGLLLLSASIDKTIIVWKQSADDGVWLEKVRVGDVGGNTLGFFGGKFSADGQAIMGHSYQGGFHIWQQSREDSVNWQPSVIIGGHFDEVRDIGFEPAGQYLMSVSADQTSRIHAPWIHSEDAHESTKTTWHELARPQVHGYDMQALAILSRYKFASGAEEKIIRTFQSSSNFIENFRHLCRPKSDKEGEELLASLPKGASVPSLGLSNKAVYNVDTIDESQRHVKDEYPENYFVPVNLSTPPQEETLIQNTLWPEVQKLYGHGFEIYALAATRDGRILASSCRATNAEHAQIILWNTRNWKIIHKLSAHQLTVTQMRFSPDNQNLLAVSRDRRWSLFTRHSEAENDSNPDFTLTAITDKSNGIHTRIIWACDWSHDSNYFATTSRDGKLVVWTKHAQDNEDNKDKSLSGWHSVDIYESKKESFTAIAYAPHCSQSGSYVLALGLECGLIEILECNKELSLLFKLNNNAAHHLTVRRLQFRPRHEDEKISGSHDTFHLASCGDDHLVRIYDIRL